MHAAPAGNADPGRIRRAAGRVDLLLASPDCTSHTHARGARAPDDASRRTALLVADYARALDPRWIVVENVVNFLRWDLYGELRASLERLGYGISEEVLDAADFGVPQSRRRLFLLCARGAAPAPMPRRPDAPRRTARSAIDLDGYPMAPLETGRRAAATIARADRAAESLGARRPFLLVYYGSDRAGGWQRLDAPLRTVTTVDRFALVRRRRGRRVMRMLQPPELERAMGFDRPLAGRAFRLGRGSRRDRVRLLGNAVCPPVMESVVRHLCG